MPTDGQKKIRQKGITMYDIIIIGAGVSGAATARELSRYKAKICVVEKEEDVCCGTSKANSAIVHAGYDAVPGSLKAKLNVRGNRMMDNLAKELDIPFKRSGSFVICTDEENLPALQELYERGISFSSNREAMPVKVFCWKAGEKKMESTTISLFCIFSCPFPERQSPQESSRQATRLKFLMFIFVMFLYCKIRQ